MSDQAAESSRSEPLSTPLLVMALFYGGMVCVAGILGNKQLAIGPLAVEAGIFAFLMLVVTASAVTELYGRTIGNRLVLLGFLPLLASLLLTLLVLAAPAAPEMSGERLSAFETMMTATPRIWLGGLIAYGTSQILNVTIFSWLKRRQGGLLALRSAVASVISQAVDTLIFITVAFYGVFPIADLLLGQLVAKLTLSVILVPPLVYIFVSAARSFSRSAR